MTISFQVPFVAVQQRSRKGKNGWYAPSAKEQKIIGQFALVAFVEARQDPFKGDVHLHVTAYGLNKGDASNCLKLIEDGLNGVAYVDDDQIVFETMRKIRDSDHPRMDVEIQSIE